MPTWLCGQLKRLAWTANSKIFHLFWLSIAVLALKAIPHMTDCNCLGPKDYKAGPPRSECRVVRPAASQPVQAFVTGWTRPISPLPRRCILRHFLSMRVRRVCGLLLTARECSRTRPDHRHSVATGPSSDAKSTHTSISTSISRSRAPMMSSSIRGLWKVGRPFLSLFACWSLSRCGS